MSICQVSKGTIVLNIVVKFCINISKKRHQSCNRHQLIDLVLNDTSAQEFNAIKGNYNQVVILIKK